MLFISDKGGGRIKLWFLKCNGQGRGGEMNKLLNKIPQIIQNEIIRIPS